jgi:hypothetical protein
VLASAETEALVIINPRLLVDVVVQIVAAPGDAAAVPVER